MSKSFGFGRKSRVFLVEKKTFFPFVFPLSPSTFFNRVFGRFSAWGAPKLKTPPKKI
jgi:hypothetical protein